MKAPVTFERYAIFQTGGKQYQALEGKTLAIEKIEGEPGDKLEFKEVLIRKTGVGAVEIGKPYVIKACIKAVIIKQMRDPKLTVFLFKRRKKVMRKKGHRQPRTVIRIESI
jgi:large subunit ribosomal protein L21